MVLTQPIMDAGNVATALLTPPAAAWAMVPSCHSLFLAAWFFSFSSSASFSTSFIRLTSTTSTLLKVWSSVWRTKFSSSSSLPSKLKTKKPLKPKLWLHRDSSLPLKLMSMPLLPVVLMSILSLPCLRARSSISSSNKRLWSMVWLLTHNFWEHKLTTCEEANDSHFQKRNHHSALKTLRAIAILEGIDPVAWLEIRVFRSQTKIKVCSPVY